MRRTSPPCTAAVYNAADTLKRRRSENAKSEFLLNLVDCGTGLVKRKSESSECLLDRSSAGATCTAAEGLRMPGGRVWVSASPRLFFCQ